MLDLDFSHTKVRIVLAAKAITIECIKAKRERECYRVLKLLFVDKGLSLSLSLSLIGDDKSKSE